MKRICVISLHSYFEKTGGGLALKRLIDVLQMQSDVRLSIVMKEFDIPEKFRFKNAEYISVRKNRWLDILARILFRASFLSLFTRRILSCIRDCEYIIVHHSRLGHLIRAIKKKYPAGKVVCVFDNFEFKLAEAYFRKFGLAAAGVFFLEKLNVTGAEKNSLVYADKVIYLTQKDRTDIETFYKISKPNDILPLFINDPLDGEIPAGQTSDRLNFIFTGSLEYFPNIEAVDFILDNINIFSSLFKDIKYSITIAGKNPDDTMIQRCKTKGIALFPNPGDTEMNSLFLCADIFLSPVFSGSGMKTKIAEALSFGLPIIASSHSLLGYEEIEAEERKGIIREFSDYSKEEFKKALSHALISAGNRKKILFGKAREIWRKYYSYERFKTELLQKLLP